MLAQHSRNRLYIAGGLGENSIGPKVHEYIAKSLRLDWTCVFLRLTSIDEVMEIFQAPDFAGGIVTMPHKRAVIPRLDHYDDIVNILGACNFVYRTPNGQLHGTNTDWVGIYDAILAQSPGHVPGRTGMVYGAGGASRAAVYALWTKLNCDKIYAVNRDDGEVAELLADLHRQPNLYLPEIVHVRHISECTELPSPYYVVSTVPDFEAVTLQEVEARNILVEFLWKSPELKGLLLDMCYHPPMTRNLKLAMKHRYSIVQGFTVVASQFSCQWKLWTGATIETNEVFEMTERLVREREDVAAPTAAAFGVAVTGNP
ncbi:Fc.00g011160.m01.CDS01 [Cosmosporella sp. VM-42]